MNPESGLQMHAHTELKTDDQATVAAGAPTSGNFMVLRRGLGPGLRFGLGSDGVVKFPIASDTWPLRG